jgi:hypothetical protein
LTVNRLPPAPSPGEAAFSSNASTTPSCALPTLNSTSPENVPRSGAPARAVVKARPISRPPASRTLGWTVPSKTLAVPVIATGLETLAPGGGILTTIGAGSPPLPPFASAAGERGQEQRRERG